MIARRLIKTTGSAWRALAVGRHMRGRGRGTVVASAFTAEHSRQTMGRDMLHVTWAVMQALNDEIVWPSASERDATHGQAPSALHDYVDECACRRV